VIASLRYDLAIPLPEKEQEAVDLTALSLLVALTVSLITAVVVIPFGASIAIAFNVPMLGDYIWLLPLGLFLMGAYQVFTNWAVRKKAFPVIAKTKVTQSFSMVVVQIAGHGVGPLALVVGRIFGQAIGISRLATNTIRDFRLLNARFDYNGIIKAAVRYRSFPIYSSWSGLLSTGGPQVPPILFSLFYGASAAGTYYLAHRVIALPLTVIGGSISNVYMPDAVQALRENRLRSAVEKVHATLSHIAMPPAVTLFLIAPDIFTLAFGENWAQAGEIVRWLTPMLFFQFVVSPLSRTFTVMERQRLGLSLHVILFALRMLAIVIPTWASLRFTTTVFWYSMASCIGYIAFAYGTSKIAKSRFSLNIKDWFLSFLVGLALNIFLFIYYLSGSITLFFLGVSVFITAILVGFFYRNLATKP